MSVARLEADFEVYRDEQFGPKEAVVIVFYFTPLFCGGVAPRLKSVGIFTPEEVAALIAQLAIVCASLAPCSC